MKILLNTSNIYGKHRCTNKVQDISKTQDPSTRSFHGTRFEDQIICKIGFVDSSSQMVSNNERQWQMLSDIQIFSNKSYCWMLPDIITY